MQEASFYGLFRTIVFMIGFYYLVKFLARIFMPMIMQNMVNKAQENFQKQQAQSTFNQANQSSSQDFESSKNQNPKSKKQVGDYIDYEEVE
ncbi:DUF4834 family protein [Flavobacterium humi]|uniref:DUF4834 family protein n=1 Tax=Flavobacterium humi TaxID=2562683 RepID=A0A4Z0LAB2_9FLAO|nr:DUF4834 family protein [Flavobacterium humi]TGD58862.1 DUF4834 family protein [Flavobacterium humi]